MDALRNSAIVFCVCTIATSIISVILPCGRMKKIINLVLGLFFICSMIVPVVGIINTVNYDFDGYNDISLSETPDECDFEEAVLNKTADKLVIATNNLLNNNGISCDNIEVGIKKSDNNSIYISSINIYISKNLIDKTEEIKKLISSNMLKEPVIIVSES